MIDILQDNWILFAIVLVIGLLTAWWIWSRRDSDDGLTSEDHDSAMEAVDRSPQEMAEALTRDRDSKIGDAARDELTIARQPEAKANPIAAMPIAAAPAAPEPSAQDKPKIAAALGEPDDLRKIKGVGPKLNTLLGTLGVTRYDQIAAWGDTEIAEVDGYLGNFKGRITRDNWVDQAGYLAKDDIAGFEAKYGKI